MALQSICPRCQNPGFELVTEVPKHSAFKMSFIRCDKCGTVVGVTEYFNIAERINMLAKRLDIDL